jgi:hypothetical protein
MPQILMPPPRPNQMDALAAVLNIGQAIYGIKYKAEEMERAKQEDELRRIAANEESQIRGLQRSQLLAAQQAQQKQDLLNEQMARGEFSPLQLPKFLKESNLALSNQPTQLKVKVGGQDVYLKPAEDVDKEYKIAQTQLVKKQAGEVGKVDPLKQEQILNYQAQRTLIYANAQKIANETGMGKPLTPTEIDKHAEGASIPNLLNDLKATIKNNEKSFGPVAGLAKFNPYSEKAATIQSQFKTAAQLVGKYMEGGVLRKEDESKYEKMLPQITDTPAVAQNKIDIVMKLLIDKYNTNVNSLKKQGYNISGLPTFEKGKTPSIISQNNLSDKIISPAQAEQQKNIPVFNPNKKFIPREKVEK